MKKQLAIAAGIAGVLALAAGGVAVNAATLNASQTSDLGRVPGSVVDDRGRGADDSGADDSASPTPSSSASTEPGDDGLPRHSGLDDGATHDAGDDNLPQHSGLDDGAGHDVGDDHGGSGSGSSGSGSGSSGSGSSGGSDDSGHGGHGGSGRDD